MLAVAARVSLATKGHFDEVIEAIDDMIEELQVEVKDREDEVETIKDEVKKAEKIRDEEKAAWEQSNEDDTSAAELVDKAKEVLANFYEENDLNLIQKSKAPPTVVAGEAPPP